MSQYREKVKKYINLNDDAGQTNIQIVTTNIKADGKRTSLHHLANNDSESSRKAIEEI